STIFVVYGSFIIHYDGVPISDASHLSILQDASGYGPTVFPILFAAIVGQAMHAIAHWRLENGERMKVLDQLLGSTGIFSAVATQFKFQNMGFVVASLICLWALSPIGGQASLRVLEYGSNTTSHLRTMHYLDWNSAFAMSQKGVGPHKDAMEVRFVASRLFVASLASTRDTQLSSMDSWGNVKIPMLERLPALPDEEGWLTVDYNKNITYTAQIGVPISELSTNYNTTFNMELAYWTLDCPDIKPESERDPSEPWLPGVNTSASLAQGEGWFVGYSRSWALSTPMELWRWNTTDFTNIPRRVIYYRGADDDSGQSWNETYAECHMSTSYVEVAVQCFSKSCSITHIRPSLLPHRPSSVALGIDPFYAGFIRSFHETLETKVFQRPSVFQRYFVQPYAPFTSANKSLDIFKVGKVSFETSFAQLLNSYWQAGISIGQVTSGIPPAEQINSTWFTKDNGMQRPYYRSMNATETQTIPTVKCNKSWLAALFIATGAMFLAGAFGLVLEITRRAPDFALNISSLMRDNPYLDIPAGGSALDALERSRLLQ
ncbi:hypothetical protein BS50DRAFT_475081, partial [Corynespora cassiicola Philippines]